MNLKLPILWRLFLWPAALGGLAAAVHAAVWRPDDWLLQLIGGTTVAWFVARLATMSARLVEGGDIVVRNRFRTIRLEAPVRASFGRWTFMHELTLSDQMRSIKAGASLRIGNTGEPPSDLVRFATALQAETAA